MKSSPERTINLEEIDAVIFDMDGVVTETAFNYVFALCMSLVRVGQLG